MTRCSDLPPTHSNSTSTRLILLAFALTGIWFTPVSGEAQSHYFDTWYFGSHAGLDFSTTPPTPVYGELSTNEGTASISDPQTGQLLFYTNGVNVWNRDHKVMMNGSGLYGDPTSSQSALIVPHPGDPSLYYLFTADAGPYSSSGTLYGINYSLVDMKEDGGRGAIVLKNDSLLGDATERMVAVRHCNGRDFWVIGHHLGSSDFYAWLVSCDGIRKEPVISSVGRVNDRVNPSASIGTLKASPDGKYLFSIMANISGELFEFDNGTGSVGRQLMDIEAGYGSSFSPNSQFLYVVFGSLMRRFRVGNNPLPTVKNIPFQQGGDTSIVEMYALQIGPDQNIYVSSIILGGPVRSSRLLRITDPDNNPVLEYANFNFDGLNAQSVVGLPNCIDGYLSSVPIPKCESSATIIIRNPDTTICAGETVRPELLTSPSGQYEYTWTFPGGSPATSSSKSPGPVRFDTPGTYRLIVQGRSGCVVVTDSMDVTVLERPTITLSDDRTLCLGDTVQLHAASNGTVEWSPSDGLSCTGCTDPIASPAGDISYIVTATNAAGCSLSDTVHVTIVGSIQLEGGVDTAICAGESVQFHLSGADRYEWEYDPSLSCTDCPDPVVAPAKTTTYVVRGSAGSNCEEVDTIVVTVNPLPIIDAGEHQLICSGSTVTLGLFTPEPGVEYEWSPATDLDAPSSPHPTASPLTKRTYYLTARSLSSGCDVVDSVTIDVGLKPSLLLANDTAVCSGTAIRLSTTEPEPGVSYAWSPVEGLDDPTSVHAIALPSRSITYVLRARHDQSDCETIDSIEIEVHDRPGAEAGENLLLCPTTGGNIGSSPVPGMIYRWTPQQGLSDPTSADPVATPAATTLYYLEVEDQVTGCRSTDSVLVEISPYVLIETSIDRDYRGLSDQGIPIRVETGEIPAFAGIDRLVFDLLYNGSLMQINPRSIEKMLDTTLLKGWSLRVIDSIPGHLSLEFTAPPGVTLSGKGTLFLFEGRVYLGSVQGTELSYSFPGLMEGDNACIGFTTSPGYARLDTLCGLNFRLIEAGVGRFAPPVAIPNPSGKLVTLEFGIGLDGPTTMEIFDAGGRLVGELVDSYLDEGTYRVQWQSPQSGRYWVRLTCGEWQKTVPLMIQE